MAVHHAEDHACLISVSMGIAGPVPRIAWVIHAGVDGATHGRGRPVPSVAAGRYRSLPPAPTARRTAPRRSWILTLEPSASSSFPIPPSKPLVGAAGHRTARESSARASV